MKIKTQINDKKINVKLYLLLPALKAIEVYCCKTNLPPSVSVHGRFNNIVYPKLI